MRFKVGEHVKARLRGWYGQVVARKGTTYTVRLGGATNTFDLAEDELEPIHPDGVVVTAPPLNIVPGGGSFTMPTLAYVFSNEPGLGAGKPLWTDLDGLPYGAFLGVSGSILDFACHQWGSCGQIVCTDINTHTARPIDILRNIVALLRQIKAIHKAPKHKAQLLGGPPLALETKAALLGKVIGYWRSTYLSFEELVMTDYEFTPMSKGRLLAQQLGALQPYITTTPCSSWFTSDVFLDRLGTMIEAQRMSILCGDLQNHTMQETIIASLQLGVSLFNFSNAMDYVKNPEAIAAFFEKLPHNRAAVVVASSQVAGLTDDLGTFAVPKVIPWSTFITILRKPALKDYFGSLL